MIESLIFLFLFLAAYLFMKDSTYAILSMAASLNVALYSFTGEYSVMPEFFLDATILIALIVFANKHYWYQIGLLMLAIMLHLQFEMDQLNGTDFIFSNYSILITGITIMQLLGVSNGVLERIWKNNQYRRLHTWDSSLSKAKTWPKD